LRRICFDALIFVVVIYNLFVEVDIVS